MTIQGLKWGSSRPEEEAYAAGVRIAVDACELTVLDGHKQIYVATTYFDAFHEVRVSEHSLFEKILSLDDTDDADTIIKEINSDLLAGETFENYENENWSEEGKYYEDAMEITISCMDEYLGDVSMSADEFIAPYVGMDVSEARFAIVDGGFQQMMKEKELIDAVNMLAETVVCRLMDATRRGLRTLTINVLSNGRIVVYDEKNNRIVDKWLGRQEFKNWKKNLDSQKDGEV